VSRYIELSHLDQAIVEQTAEAISTVHLAAGGNDRIGWRARHSLLEALVRPGLVVVIEELGQHPL